MGQRVRPNPKPQKLPDLFLQSRQLVREKHSLSDSSKAVTHSTRELPEQHRVHSRIEFPGVYLFSLFPLFFVSLFLSLTDPNSETQSSPSIPKNQL